MGDDLSAHFLAQSSNLAKARILWRGLGTSSSLHPVVEQAEHRCAFWGSREGGGVSKATLASPNKGAGGVEQQVTFQQTLHTVRLIWQEKTAFAIYGQQGTCDFYHKVATFTKHILAEHLDQIRLDSK